MSAPWTPHPRYWGQPCMLLRGPRNTCMQHANGCARTAAHVLGHLAATWNGLPWRARHPLQLHSTCCAFSAMASQGELATGPTTYVPFTSV